MSYEQPQVAAPPAPREAPAPTAAPAENWHRFHYPIGVFLIVYGVVGVLLLAIGWGERQDEMSAYLSKTIGLDIATPALIVVKVVEVLLTLLAVAGLLRRRDVWFLPAIFGWIGGFAVFCVLDVWSGRLGGLAEHAVYLLGFLVLLALSFALGVRARVARAGQVPAADRVGTTSGKMRLTRTQEIALAALNRWQRIAPKG